MAANKNELERTLASAISAIHDRLPGLKLYQHIYNDDDELDIRLQSEIVAAYQRFMEFCIKATRYYTSSGIRKTPSPLPFDSVIASTRSTGLRD